MGGFNVFMFLASTATNYVICGGNFALRGYRKFATVTFQLNP